MFKKLVSMAMLVLWLVVLVNGAAVMAQDVCVTEYMANLATPTTVTELRQYLEDIRQVLSECDPVSENVIEIEPSANLDEDDFIEDDNGCLAGILIGARESEPDIFGMAGGDSRLGMLFELKKPGASRFKEASPNEFMSDQIDDINVHTWDDSNMPKGRYEVRYEAFIGADPVTLAFEVEHNAEYRIAVFCD